MCSPASRVIAGIAVLIALVTACGPAASRSGRDRDRIVRATRVGPQRTEALEGAHHGHDEGDSVTVPVGHAIVSGPDRIGPAFQVATLPAAAPLPARPRSLDTAAAPGPPPRPTASLDAHAPDRAPPAA